MISCGNYSGGNLIIYNEDRSQVRTVSTNRNPILADGRLLHAITPVTEGQRYWLVIYRHYDPSILSTCRIWDYTEAHPFSEDVSGIPPNVDRIRKEVESITLKWLNKPNVKGLTPNASKVIDVLVGCNDEYKSYVLRPYILEYINLTKKLFPSLDEKMNSTLPSK